MKKLISPLIVFVLCVLIVIVLQQENFSLFEVERNKGDSVKSESHQNVDEIQISLNAPKQDTIENEDYPEESPMNLENNQPTTVVKQEYIAKSEYSSNSEFSQLYIYETGQISQKYLSRTFMYSNLSRLISEIKELDKSQQDYENEHLLSEYINSKIDDPNISTEYVCAGTVCLLNIDDSERIERETLEELDGFRNNYAFMNYLKKDNGSTSFRAVFIQTDDPSSLTIKDDM